MADIDYALVAANCAAYAVLLFQVLWKGRARPAANIIEAYGSLLAEVKKAVPSLPAGFTWREALDETRKMKLKVDWAKVDGSLAEYEKVRYGGLAPGGSDYIEVINLVKELKGSK